MVVGIPCTVVSQWQVVDHFSSSFMHAFYLYLRKGADVAQALRYSMLHALKKNKEVYEWGPMVVCGLPNVKLPRELLELKK